MIKKMSKKKTIVFLIITILIIGCFIWYRELGTNKEVPKKAKFVNSVLLESEDYQ
ncbi:MAG: hypothetical protein GX320_04600 [Tissierellia bacterium]|nr:hypothetical protein [Tissierellia bacterium]